MGDFWKEAKALIEMLEAPNAKRTICCNALMYDLWMHTNDCPIHSYIMTYMRSHNGVLPKNYPVNTCETCGYTPYKAGTECPHCEYTDGHSRFARKNK